MLKDGLPLWPSKGNRRGLEALWLEELEREGWRALAPDAPSQGPPELYQAIEEFNRGAFWECHETLEGVWRSTPYPLRFFYHAIIKAAVGFYHLSRCNRHGARVKLSDSQRLLRLLPADFWGINTEELCDETSNWLERLTARGSVDWGHLDGLTRPRIRVQPVKAPATPRE